MRSIAILGAGGHGKVVGDIAESDGWDEVVFFDDAWPELLSCGDWAVAGNSQSLIERLNAFSGVVVAAGNNAIRSEKLTWLEQFSAPIVTLVHPVAVISQYATLGSGVVVMPGVVVNAASTVGRGVILNTGCTIDHDCIIGDFAHVSPGAHLGGAVHVGEKSWVGIGASIRQAVKVGAGVVVGAGAAVVSDIEDQLTVVGVPAKPISRANK